MPLHTPFKTSDEELQSYLFFNADVSLLRGDVTFKLLVDKVTKVDKESVRHAEIELSKFILKDYSYGFSKMVKILAQIIDALKANAAFKSDYFNIVMRFFMDDECVE